MTKTQKQQNVEKLRVTILNEELAISGETLSVAGLINN